MEITQELKDLVIKEATNLKKYAHADELAKLDFTWFDGTLPNQCICGQMTGMCYSKRAHELIFSSCERVYNPQKGEDHEFGRPATSKLNGKPEKIRDGSLWNAATYWSPIEVFVDILESEREREQLKPLISFLKGKTETLAL